jgi:MutS domain III
MRRSVVASTGRPSSAESTRREESSRNAMSSIESVYSEVTDLAGDDPVPMEASMTCVSVVEEGSQIAFACYNEESNDILLEQSYANGHDTEEVVERFLAVARPNLILVGNKIVANAALLYVLTRPPPLYEGIQGETGATGTVQRTEQPSQQERATPYRLLKSSAFDVRRCRALILEKLRVLSLLRRQQAPHVQHTGNPNRERRFPNTSWSRNQVFSASSYHSLASVVDFDSSVQVRALGTLISFLQSTIFRLEEGETVTVNTINQAKTTMFMRINSVTLRALHIFATEHHPLMAKGYGHTKEGFSLFSLLDRTKSKVGRQRLREWMLKPLLDRSEISRRQDGVELFLRTEFQTSVGVLLNWLEKIGPVDRIIVRMQKCNTSPMDFSVLSRTLSAALAVADLLANEFLAKLATLASACQLQEGDQAREKLAALARYHAFLESIVQKCCVSVLQDLEERITSIVDEALTMEAKDAVVIQTGFHEELDAAKETFDTLDGKFALLETTTAGWKRTICFLLCMLLLLRHQKRCRQSEYRLLKDTRP